MNPVMNADGSDPKNSSERRLTAGYIACPGKGFVSFFHVHAALLGVT